TRINAHNDVEWIPPAHLDTGQARVNDYHRPERLHRPPDDEPPADNEPSAEDERPPDDELLAGDDHPHQPGGPEPNAA
ncbi:MAG: HNH endonuclease signature motif containing protein, partial [Mycobacterium sp.]